MENIEIKAAYPDLDVARTVCENLGCRLEATLHQVDTYFSVARGRLKLREIAHQKSQLIYYQRPDQEGPKLSRYEIVAVQNPAELKTMLNLALGVWKVVEKQRELYLYDEVRIHLDRVKSLGNFLEFEGVVQNPGSKSATAEKVDLLISKFGIQPRQLISASYSDLSPKE